MLGIQNQPNLMAKNVSFKGISPDLKYDIENERDQKVNQYATDKAEWDEFANNLEQSDNKVAKKASKIVRFGATLLGLAATFFGAKYGSRLTIETLKSFSKNKTVVSIMDKLKKLKKPAGEIIDKIKTVAENPTVKDIVNKVKTSKVGQKVDNFVKNEKVAKILDPLKETLKSIKGTKFDSKKVQNFIENTMAASAAGSVAIDDLAGRNNDKSSAELAMGV